MKSLWSKRKKSAWMRISTMAKGKGVSKKIAAEQQNLGVFVGFFVDLVLGFFLRQKRESDNAVTICELDGVCFGKENRFYGRIPFYS